MKRLLIASHQLPAHIIENNGNLTVEPTDELQISGLKEFYDSYDSLWIGFTNLQNQSFSLDNSHNLVQRLMDFKCIPLVPDMEDYDNYYHGFARNTLWPLFHFFPQNVTYNDSFWNAYQTINQLFAEKILQHINPGDILWIHDYHLLLLPRIIQEKMPDVSIGLFIHIPFPSFEAFRLLPWRTEILEGMLGADLIGFHTYDYNRHFISCVRRILGYDTMFNRIAIEDRTLKVDAFPKGINYSYFIEEKKRLQKDNGTKRSKIQEEIENYLTHDKHQKLIISIDRLDYTKGIPQRLRAFELFLETFSDYCEKVTLLLLALPTGETHESFNELKREVDELVGRINGTYGTLNWAPIRYINQEYSLRELIDLYAYSDIALILPLRDGMNMVAKEYVASRIHGKGVLILSEMAGASKELHEALIVNPNNLSEIIIALKDAMEMPEEEQIRRNKVMAERLQRYSAEKWAREFIKGLEGVKELQKTKFARKITAHRMEEISNTYAESQERILFLDYDGTLSWFKKNPADAQPDQELYDILHSLTADKKNSIVIISGRDKETLGDWFDPSWNIHFIAEHGVWLRDPGGEWHMMEQIDNMWQESIRPLLEFYVDQTPRTFIEEKNFSLVWHYRTADPDLGIQRAWELKDELRDLTANLNLEILDGDKVLEIKYSGINKGRAANQKLVEKSYDFILAVGDDWTDEYTFEAMPEEAFTIKVGTKTTKASYYIESVDQVRKMLKNLLNQSS